MSNLELTAIEKEMAAFNPEDWKDFTQSNKSKLASAEETRSNICELWQKIRKFVKLAENIPFVGKYISILANFLDTLCPTT